MGFGKITSPMDSRHPSTAVYTAADIREIVREGATISLYVPVAVSALGLSEAPSRTTGFDRAEGEVGNRRIAAGRVRASLRRPPVSVDVDTLLEAEREGA
jgi:hypothetical protein